MKYNLVMLAGNLTRDPEVKFLADQKAVAQFGLAVNRTFKNSAGEKQEEVTFVDIECWGVTAQMAGQYLTKGKGVFIQGRLKMDTWTDTATGTKRSKLKVVADLIQFTGAPTGDRQPTGGPNVRDDTNLTPAAPSPAAAPAALDEPPF